MIFDVLGLYGADLCGRSYTRRRVDALDTLALGR